MPMQPTLADMLLPIAGFALIQLLAVISPGQSFVVVTRLALARGSRAGVAAALGMGAGSVIWALAALAGFAFVLERAGWLFALLKAAGGLYLAWLALLLWRGARAPLAAAGDAVGPAGGGRAFLLGLSTQLANPKVAVFFGSVFFAVLPAHATLAVYAVCVALVFVNETVWYSLVAVLFASGPARRAYARARVWIDRTMAVLLGGLGLGLLADAGRTWFARPG